MDRNNVLNYTHSEDDRLFRAARFEQDLSEVESDISWNKGIMLIVALMLSLTLWAVIGIAVAALIGNRPI
jgi:hypothetical protein